MALKRQHQMVSLFSMASMTDVIFLLLIFFMVTSTFVFPTALDITLPQSSEQVVVRPTTRVYIDANGLLYVSTITDDAPTAMDFESLEGFLVANSGQNPDTDNIAIYADGDVTYSTIVGILDIGARNNLKMVLATKPAPASAKPLSPAPQQ